MRYFENTTDFFCDGPSAVTLGKFDGLHRGHQKLIQKITELKKEGMKAVVFSLAPDERPYLLSPEEKRRKVEAFGMDVMIRCPFIPEILNMEPEQFVSEILKKQLHTSYVVVGADWRFGHERKGDVTFLQSLQKKYEFEVMVIEKECCRGREISSTYVKQALAKGDMELVEELLGYPYEIGGVVQHGQRLGRRLGMPTVNLIPEAGKLLPPCGVYYSDVQAEGQTYHGVTNIGYKPTVDGSFLGVETYLYGFHQEIYGREATVRLRHYSRPEQKFDSINALKHQMKKDIASGKGYFRVS